jgi:hypothetical protein
MIKTLLREKKYVAVVAGVVIVALFAAVLYIIMAPAGEVAANGASDVEPEPQVVATADIAVVEPNDNQETPQTLPETETPIDDIDIETVEEVADIKNEEEEGNNKEEGNDEENSQDQPQYIGRQPPEGYVEPEGDSRHAFQLEYKDTYQSNIVVMWEEIWDIDYRDYAWFHPAYHIGPSTSGVGAYQFLVYAILTYYDGDVPCDYYVSFREDVHNRHPGSSMIFEVQTHGERPLNICLDMYNYKIRVEEGIVKED